MLGVIAGTLPTHPLIDGKKTKHLFILKNLINEYGYPKV